MNANEITKNYEEAAKELQTAADQRRSRMAELPFDHKGQCEVCEKWINYDDRMLFTEEEGGKETVTCYWCAMHPKYEWAPNHEQAMRMIKHILQNTAPKPVPVKPELPEELLGTVWEYMPPDCDHVPSLDRITQVGDGWVELESMTWSKATTEVDFEWLRKAYVQHKATE